MFQKIMSLIITPLLLGMHWWTGHTAWLYVFGAMSVVTILVGGLGFAALLYAYLSDGVKADKLPVIPAWRHAFGIVYQVGATVYLLWTESYVTASLFLVGLICVWGVIALGIFIRKEHEAERAFEADKEARRIETANAVEAAYRDMAG